MTSLLIAAGLIYVAVKVIPPARDLCRGARQFADGVYWLEVKR